ncbi:TonB-dependent receptor [Vineibacter terrae]|uniref:TonB-dependent receptor n=1 Tax=Vineibacter terrae TaxID=2586908 RepID=UPI002E33E422|nr:TonB-dependent receptor [Vineibacter terrae]HEX2889341.1 TonB-dependent receptor [Vineibacter terrae]
MGRSFAGAALLAWLPATVLAQAPAPHTPPAGSPPAPATPAPTLPDIVVIGSTPMLGSGIARDKVPGASYVLKREDMRITGGVPNLLDALDARVGGISLNQAQNNPFQPNLLFRGFEASPLAGNAQGLAVYVNGVRFNQPFGDTVNWDLIPSMAIDRVEIQGSNPVYGLNALGGAVAVQLKNGFTYQGAEYEVMGGSFGRVTGAFQMGKQFDGFAIYVAGSGLHESGWRDFSPSTLRQFYGDLGWRGSKGQVNLSVLAANNSLVGNGTAPVELLAADRNSVFTHPDKTKNKYLRVSLAGRYEINDEISLDANAYYSRFSHRTKNGDASEAEACEDDQSQLCLEEDGPRLRDRSGNVIPNYLVSPFLSIPAFADRFDEGGPYAQLNRTNTNTEGFGAALQLTHQGQLFGRSNRFIVGASYDGGRTRFKASSELGGLTLDRGVAGSGLIISQPDGSVTPVSVRASNDYFGIYMSDVLDVTDALSLTLGGRFNVAKIQLRDQIGTSLNGNHTFTRFNPAAGVTYKVTPGISVYAGYAEASRAPTPAELSCADPAAPCSLTNFFVGDPPLKQVVARTMEAGVRGQFKVLDTARVTWNLGLFRTNTDDDIMFVSSPIVGRAFFQNVGATRRQGLEAGAEIRGKRWAAFVDYAFTDATFRKALTMNSPENPAADDDGTIQVRRGDRLPGVPAHTLKFGGAVGVTEAWKVGMTGQFASGRYLVGDEANLNRKTGSYVVVGLNTSYDITPNIQVFGLITNLFNAKYATFGTFSPTSSVPMTEAPNATDPRSLSPGMPRAFYAGLRIRLP